MFAIVHLQSKPFYLSLTNSNAVHYIFSDNEANKQHNDSRSQVFQVS